MSEYNIGKEERNSSRVLLPPGGESSIRLGDESGVRRLVHQLPEVAESTATPGAILEPAQAVSSKASSLAIDKSVHEVSSPVSMKPASNVATRVRGKRSVGSRVEGNPITGAGYLKEGVFDINKEKIKLGAVSGKVNEHAFEMPKVVQTSIRVRNPPGGKSSGIF